MSTTSPIILMSTAGWKQSTSPSRSSKRSTLSQYEGMPKSNIEFIYMADTKVKRPEPKFAVKDHLEHITGLRGFVIDLATQMQVPIQTAPAPGSNVPGQAMQVRNLPEPVYVLAWVNKNGDYMSTRLPESQLTKV